MPADPLLLDVPSAAEMLRVSERTLWGLTIPRGPLPCVRIGRSVRYAVDDLREYVNRERLSTVKRLAESPGLTIAATMMEDDGNA